MDIEIRSTTREKNNRTIKKKKSCKRYNAVTERCVSLVIKALFTYQKRNRSMQRKSLINYRIEIQIMSINELLFRDANCNAREV